MPNKPDGYTIFCDDIRQEVGNKSSLMGVYNTGELVVHQELPQTLRLGFYIVFREDPRSPIEPMALCIYAPGDTDDKPAIKMDIEPKGPYKPPSEVGEGTRRTFAVNLVTEVPLKEPGRIKVRMMKKSVTVKLGTLKVTAAPQSSVGETIEPIG
jgi:hypothetical protein